MRSAGRLGAPALVLLALCHGSASEAAQTLVTEDGRTAVTTSAAAAGGDAGAEGADDAASAAAASAAAAAESLRAAIGRLDQALTADDQVMALGEVIGAYERGQAALRASLRRAGLREAQVRAEFDQRRDRLARIIGVMASMQQSPETLMLLHPAGPTATAQSGMVLSAVAPGLRAEAQTLKDGLDEIAAVRRIEQSAADTLAQGVQRVQQARRQLASAAADRSGMPTRFGADPAELTALLKSADTLDAFADGIGQMEQDIGAPTADFVAAQGSLPLPAMGELLRGPGRADARGIKRPGITLGTGPGALVSAPWPATIRYRGPLLDYGDVMIVEPEQGYLLVLAGMAQVFGATGDVVAAEEPLGIMGGDEGAAAEFGAAFVEAAARGEPPSATQQLYIELRKGKETLDPTEWFVMNPVIGPATDMDNPDGDNPDGNNPDSSAEPQTKQGRTKE